MNNLIKRTWQRKELVFVEDLRGMAFTQEDGAHTFSIAGKDENGADLALSGTVAGSLIRPDGTTTGMTGTIADGCANLTLSPECYGVSGRASLTIFLTSGGQKTAIYHAVMSIGKSSTSQVSPGVAADVVDLVNRIDTATASIPATYTALLGSIASDYSSSKTYKTGEHVWYGGYLYKAKQDIDTAESWTSGHWTKVVLADDFRSDITSLKSAIDKVDKHYGGFFEHGQNYFNKDTAIRGYYVSSQNGELVANNNFAASDWIEVKPNTQYYLLSNFGSAGYDENKTYVETYNMSGTRVLTTGANTKYIRFGMYQQYLDTNYLVEGTSDVAYPPYKETLKQDALPPIPTNLIDPYTLTVRYENVLNNPLDAKIVNLFNKGTITEGKFISAETGALVSNTGFFASDYIDIGAFDSITLCYTFISCLYDANKSYITNVSASIDADRTVEIPEEAKYIRISSYNRYLETVQVGQNVSRDTYVEGLKAVIDNLTVYESQIIQQSNSGKIDGVDVSFLLPDTIYLRPNEDFSLYYVGIVKNYYMLGTRYYVAQEAVSNGTYSPKGKAYDYKWHYAPVSGESFSMEFRIVDKASGAIVTSKTVNFVTGEIKSGRTKKAVVMGDSFVDGYNIVPYLVQMITDSGNTLVSLGLNSTDYPAIKDDGWAGRTYQWVTESATGGLRHDRPLSDAVWDAGWGENEEHGWTTGQTYSDLTTEQKAHGHTRNEFWNPSTNQFDFSYYMSHYHSGETCDILISEYGLNDVGWGATPPLTMLKTKIDIIIASAKAYNPDIKILLYLICPNANDNNVIGAMNNSFPNYGRTIKNCQLFNEMLLDNYQDDSNVILLASNGNFDNRYGIRYGEYEPVKFDSTIKETHTIDIHPTGIGSRYIADTMANVVHYLL